MKKPRTYKQLQQDPRVADWSDERHPCMHSNGLWIYLAPGWVTDEGLLTIHEDTVKQCCDCVTWARYAPEEWVAAQELMQHQKPWLLPAG